MDLAAAEGGAVVSIPAGLLSGKGAGHWPISECGVLLTKDPRLGSSCRHCVHLEGVDGLAEEIPMPVPEVPPDPPANGGAG